MMFFKRKAQHGHASAHASRKAVNEAKAHKATSAEVLDLADVVKGQIESLEDSDFDDDDDDDEEPGDAPASATGGVGS